MKYIITILLFIVKSLNGISCDCIMTPIEKHVKKTKYIISVKVVELLDTDDEKQEYLYSIPNHSYRVKVMVTSVLKGNFKIGQIIEINSGFSNCDIYFQDKSEYLLFLTKEQKKYLTKHCSYSEQIGNDKQVLEELKQLINK